MIKATSGLLFGLGLLVYGPQAHASAWYACSTNQRTTSVTNAAKWSTSSKTLYARNADFGSARRGNLDWSIGQWNLAPQNFSLAVSYSTSTNADHWKQNNNRNEVYVASAACGDGCAYVRVNCASGILEADVVLKSSPSRAFTDSSTKTLHFPYGGANKHTRATFLHELGHAIGLAHTSDTYSLMGDTYRHAHTNGTSSHPNVGEDDADAAVDLYGTRANGTQEVGVSHWRWKQANAGTGGYSDHAFAELRTSGGSLIASTAFRGEELRYDVTRNQVVSPRFVFENSGRSNHSSVTVRYVLSTDDTIALSDTFLRDRTPTFNRNEVYIPTDHTVTIPGTLTPNRTYYLGVIVDPTNAIQEGNEDPFGNSAPPSTSGNATYIPIYVR